MRLVLIDTKNQVYSVYENKTCLVKFKADPGYVVSAEELEIIRTQDYKTQA